MRDDGKNIDPKAIVHSNQNGWSRFYGREATLEGIRLITGQANGTIGGAHCYSEARFHGDPVRGAEIWTEFLNNHPEYYILVADQGLAWMAKPRLTDLLKDKPVAIALFGFGDKRALRDKDLVALSEVKNISAINFYDHNPHYVSDAADLIESFCPDIPRNGQITNIFGGISNIPRGHENARLVITLFGLTLFNVEVQRDENGDFISPEIPVREKLREIRRLMRPGDIFITTHDGNKDTRRVEAAYAGQTEFAGNLAHLLNRDTPLKINPENTKFRVEFHKPSGLLAHYLELDFQAIGSREGLINASYKVSEPDFLAWCEAEGLIPKFSVEEDGMHLHALTPNTPEVV